MTPANGKPPLAATDQQDGIAPAGRAAADDSNLEQLLRVLRRRWPILCLCTVLVALAAVALSLREQQKYIATASVLFLDNQYDQELFGANFATSVQDPAEQQATDLELVSMPIVATNTAKALHLSPGLVAGELNISQAGQSDVAKISVTDPDPLRAAQIANTYGEQFVLYREQQDRSQIAAAQALVKKQLAALPPAQRFGSIGVQLQDRANQLGVLAALQTGNAQVAQPASVPTSPSVPNTKRNGLLGVLLGLLLGLVAVFVTELLDKRIRGVSELESEFGLPVLGVVPESAAYAKAGIEPLPPIEAEAFALLRARLRYFNVDRKVRSLLLTSSAPNEGKTTVALNLAIAEASGANVVLVEADLRHPTLAGHLGLARTPGVAEILSHSATPKSALRRVEVPGRAGLRRSGFFLVPAGAVPPNPAELLESQSMADLLHSLSDRFDLVIVDTAPTTVVSDAIPLLRLVSGVIVVSRLDATTHGAARHLREHLQKLGAPVLGVVANAVTPQGADGYGYGYGYNRADDYFTTPDSEESAEPTRSRDTDSAEPVSANGQTPSPLRLSGSKDALSDS